MSRHNVLIGKEHTHALRTYVRTLYQRYVLVYSLEEFCYTFRIGTEHTYHSCALRTHVPVVLQYRYGNHFGNVPYMVNLDRPTMAYWAAAAPASNASRRLTIAMAETRQSLVHSWYALATGLAIAS